LDWVFVNVPNFDSENMVDFICFLDVVAFMVFGSFGFGYCNVASLHMIAFLCMRALPFSFNRIIIIYLKKKKKKTGSIVPFSSIGIAK
jgi:hypothetical protein